LRHDEAKAALVNRGAKVDAVAEEIEGNLTLLGATAIVDKLQVVDRPPRPPPPPLPPCPALLESPRKLGNWEVPRDNTGFQTGGPSDTSNTKTHTHTTDRMVSICFGRGGAGDMLAQNILDRSWSCQGYI